MCKYALQPYFIEIAEGLYCGIPQMLQKTAIDLRRIMFHLLFNPTDHIFACTLQLLTHGQYSHQLLPPPFDT